MVVSVARATGTAHATKNANALSIDAFMYIFICFKDLGARLGLDCKKSLVEDSRTVFMFFMCYKFSKILGGYQAVKTMFRMISQALTLRNTPKKLHFARCDNAFAEIFGEITFQIVKVY
jgi:hypothetical protein